MTEKPDVFFVQTDDGRIGIGWQPDPEAGGTEILRWLPDDFLREGYRALLNRPRDLDEKP